MPVGCTEPMAGSHWADTESCQRRTSATRRPHRHPQPRAPLPPPRTGRHPRHPPATPRGGAGAGGAAAGEGRGGGGGQSRAPSRSQRRSPPVGCAPLPAGVQECAASAIRGQGEMLKAPAPPPSPPPSSHRTLFNSTYAYTCSLMHLNLP